MSVASANQNHTYFRDRDGAIYRWKGTAKAPASVPEIHSPTGWHPEPTIDPTELVEITSDQAALAFALEPTISP